jgi:AraC family transcriptional regulator of adaptative response/methylated-DNA-[protein]-cysteine methyltransferase
MSSVKTIRPSYIDCSFARKSRHDGGERHRLRVGDTPKWRADGSRPLHLLVEGTNFQVRVWEALLRIPPGALVAYKGVAEHLGKPKASRAVANAVAQNPISYLIPCHRVIRSTGAFGGYGGGTARKKALHAREAAKP